MILGLLPDRINPKTRSFDSETFQKTQKGVCQRQKEVLIEFLRLEHSTARTLNVLMIVSEKF